MIQGQKLIKALAEILCHRAQWQWSAASRIYGSWCWLCRHMQSTSYPLSATYCTTTVKHAKLHTVALCSLTQRTSASAVQPGSKMKTLADSSSEWISSINLFCGTMTSHKYDGSDKKIAWCGSDTPRHVGGRRKFLSAVMYSENITFAQLQASNRGILVHHVL